MSFVLSLFSALSVGICGIDFFISIRFWFGISKKILFGSV